MSKKDEKEIVGIIPRNEYQDDLERDVAYYVSIADKPRFISTKKYTRNAPVSRFRDIREQREWEAQEVGRILKGYDGLSGKGYGWLNYAKIKGVGKGSMNPEFRATQESFFRKIEDLQENPGRGLIGYKRRRVGFSWMGSWDMLHDCITKPHFSVGMNSKGENDSRRLFGFVKFQYNNLPTFLRPRATVADRRDFMKFSYWWDQEKKKVTATKGINGVERGLQSSILSVAPVPENHEGNAYDKLFIDEAGKQEKLLELWSFGNDCLLDNTQRIGVPIIMGTVGDIDKDGKGLMDMWLNNESYDLDRFAIHGYNGLIMDEFGNDMIEEAIRWIVYERAKLKKGSKKVYDAFIQKYPLCEKDAFNQVIEGGIGNIQLINDQLIKIAYEPPQTRIGWMRKNPHTGIPDFVPHPEGKIILYDTPDFRRKHGYSAGADPADHDDVKKNRDSSNLALAIIAKPFGLEPMKLVAEYVDRPAKLDEFFEQSGMLLTHFNKTKVLIEDNRARMLNYFKAHFPELLPFVPKSFAMAGGGREMKHSVNMNQSRREQLIGLIEDLIDRLSDHIPSKRFLEECKVFGDAHSDDDFAFAVGLALMLLQSDKKSAGVEEVHVEQSRLERRGNLLVYVHSNTPITPRSLIPKNHPLYSR